jgi:hypothetical protein
LSIVRSGFLQSNLIGSVTLNDPFGAGASALSIAPEARNQRRDANAAELVRPVCERR